MMSLDTDIKIRKILTNFETIPYHCFRKHISNETPSEELLFDSANDAFKIELYQLRHELDARLVSDLLKAAFKLYSNLNYCIILVPTTMNYIPLLKHFTVTKKRKCSAVHKCTQKSFFSRIKFYCRELQRKI